MKFIIRSTIFLLLTTGITVLRAQNIVVGKLPCPEGPAVSLDTIFYASTTPMPFDQCFPLKITVKGHPKIRYFVVNPVNREGALDRSHKDYRLFINSLFDVKTGKKDFKKSYTFDVYRKRRLTRLYTTFKLFDRGENTEAILHVPPLLPNQHYEILLVTDDEKSLKILYAAGQIVFNTTGFPPGSDQIYEVSERLRQLQDVNDKNDNLVYNTVTAEKLINILAHDTLTFSQDYHARSAGVLEQLKKWKLSSDFKSNDKYCYHRRYRVFFKPFGADLLPAKENAMAFSDDYYLEEEGGNGPVSVVLKNRLNKNGVNIPFDIKGKPVPFFHDGKYEIAVLCYEELEELKPGAASNIVTRTPISFTKVLDMEIKNGAKEVNVVVNSAAPHADEAGISLNIRRTYKIIDELTQTLAVGNSYARWDSIALKAVMAQAVVCPCPEKSIKDLTQANDLYRIIGVLTVASPIQLANIQTGLVSAKDILAEPAKQNNLTARASNLKTSVTLLQLLIDFSRNLVAFDPTNRNYKAIYNAAVAYKADLQQTGGKIEKLNINTAGIYAVLQKLYSGKEIQTTIVSTESLDFMSANKLRIVPDFGLMAVFTGDRVFHFSDLAPFLGFEIDFRSINKNIPANMIYNKGVWYYLSFSAGITLTSLAIPNKRTDLFGNQNIYTGLGFRVNKILRVTSGAVWFKKVSVNPLSTEKPLGFSPYISLSLDLEVQDLFGGISKLFK